MSALMVNMKLRLVQCSKLKQATQSSYEVEPNTEQHQQRHAAVVLFFTSVTILCIACKRFSLPLACPHRSASFCQAPEAHPTLSLNGANRP